MTIYTTPLQLGYFFALLMAVLFWVRSVKQERLSDRFLGWVLFFLAIQLQDYTFGFAGINYLWNELNGFPREVDLLFGPAVYFYFKTQTNRAFRLERIHWVHLVPWLIYFSIEFGVFMNGQEAVQEFNNTTLAEVLEWIHLVARIVLLVYYLWSSLNIYKNYRAWSETQFSDTEVISFRWFRNFLYFMIFWMVCREIMGLIDELLELSFYQDWWWNLPLVCTVFYVGLQGYAQVQPQNISFNALAEGKEEKPTNLKQEQPAQKLDEKNWNQQIEAQQLYLQSDLNLSELANYLKVNSREVSEYINSAFGVNFNDYINQKRIAVFEEKIKAKEQENFTLLSIAYDCGFNSKATFNRAFKKLKGCTPKEFVQRVK